jgi:HEPN domain-containing protein
MMAKKDLKLLRINIDLDIDDELFGFHAQQACEKALKAWLAFLGVEYPRTHDIAVLLAVLHNTGVDVDRYRSLEGQTAFAVQYRYEAFSVTQSILDRHDVLEGVSELLTAVEELVGQS